MTKGPKTNTVRKAAKRAVDLAMSKDPTRTPVTVSLRRKGYQRLKNLCREQGWTVSKVLDDVIEAFLEEAEAGLD
jgi:hypothetical protein